MEAITGYLQPYREQLRYLALILSCVKLCRGMGLLCRLKSSDGDGDDVSTKPLMGALMLATLGMRLAQLNRDQTMLTLHTTSLVLNLTFLCIFYHYASPGHRRRILGKTMLIVLLISICLYYSKVGELVRVKRDLSIVMTATTSLLIILGLLQRTGCLGCLISIMVVSSKLLYALSTTDRFMLYQSMVIFSLDLLRILLLLLNTDSDDDECSCCGCGSIMGD